MSRIKKEIAKLRAIIDMLTIAKPGESVNADDLAVLLQDVLDGLEKPE